MVDENIFKKVSILVALGILAVLSIFIIWPITTSIITGLILAYIFHPAYKKIKSVVREKNISALILILLVLFLIFIPLWFLLPIMVQQFFEAYLFLQKMNISSLVSLVFPSLETGSQPFVNSFNNFISGLAGKIFSYASSIVLDLPNIALQLVIILFVFYFGVRDSEALLGYMKSLSPFSKSAEEEIITKFKAITNSVIYGHIIVGIIQGLLTGLGLLIFGVHNAIVLTIIAILASVIPVLGAWLVWVPSAVYLMASGNVGRGIGLLLFGAILVSWIDNVIRPYIISRKSKVHTGIVLVGMLGGLIVFGILGLIIGPLILAYLLLVLDAYRKKQFPGLFSQKL